MHVAAGGDEGRPRNPSLHPTTHQTIRPIRYAETSWLCVCRYDSTAAAIVSQTTSTTIATQVCVAITLLKSQVIDIDNTTARQQHVGQGKMHGSQVHAFKLATALPTHAHGGEHYACSKDAWVPGLGNSPFCQPVPPFVSLAPGDLRAVAC